ncbi:hypothetical protein [Sphingomonas faeni]|nr:hypothetical protein [Sphingomonas faeni]MCP8892179.1 hypothetical protein [Sphingomonas faeni]
MTDLSGRNTARWIDGPFSSRAGMLTAQIQSNQKAVRDTVAHKNHPVTPD